MSVFKIVVGLTVLMDREILEEVLNPLNIETISKLDPKIIEYSGLDNIKIYHDYKDEDTIKRLNLSVSNGIQ